MAARAAIFGCAGLALTPDEARFFRDADPWGFILFVRNVETPDQLRKLTAALREAVGRAAPILVDQEGGRVQRLRAPHWREWDDAAAMLDGLAPEAATEAMALRYRLIAEELRQVGLDANCAPTLDLRLPETHAAIGPRAYSGDPEIVARLGAAVLGGLEAGGVRAVIKHMPGHGRATVDSHCATPVVAAARETLAAQDFAPFRALRAAKLGMTAHIRYAGLDPERPGTLSPAVIRAIREEIGFDGCLMTDDISMGALNGPMAERCKGALAAGCDLILHCNGDRAEMEAVAGATPRLAGASSARAEIAARPLEPQPFDSAAARDRFARLTGSAAHA